MYIFFNLNTPYYMNNINQLSGAQSVPYLWSFDLKFSDGKQQRIDFTNQQDFDLVLKKVIEKPLYTNTVATIFFGQTSVDNIEKRMKIFQESALTNVLQFRQTSANNSMVIEYKILKTEDLGEGKTKRVFANGVIETFDTNNQCHRVLPDGTQEKGKFNNDNQFVCAYKTEIDGCTTFIHPKHLIHYTDKSSNKYRYESIVEFQDKLIVLEQKFNRGSKNQFRAGKRPLLDVLLSFSNDEAYNNSSANKLKKVLEHKLFKNHLPDFFERVLMPDKSGDLHLFGLPKIAITVIIEVGARSGYIDPLKIIDPISKQNLFVHAVSTKNSELLEKLIEFFPEQFQSIALGIIEDLIMQGFEVPFVQNLINQVPKIKSEIPYYELWLQIADKEPDQKFHTQFALLTEKHKKILYEAAFAYRCTFVYEPATVPVKPEQYSINLMWINDKKISSDQQFLFGNGYTPENQALDFNKRFVEPVSAWAEKNPGTQINIWVDGLFATPEAIERSRIKLEEVLKDKSHGEVVFRDVRTISTVTRNGFVFSQFFPIYFRVDLLRAIVADYVLKNKEVQYFVYGDIDMKSLSGAELFDQRTINYLNEHGGVMAKGGHHGYENGFQIFNGNHAAFMNAHLKTIINTNLNKADQGFSNIREQQVYDSYPKMWSVLLDSNNENLLRKKIPTKPVQLPPSHFG